MERKPKKWEVNSVDPRESSSLATKAKISPLLAKLLLRRGIDTPEKAQKFLHPTYEDLHSPFLLNDMEKAVDRIRQAIDREEKICIYGDYDADGTCSTVLLLNTFQELGVPADHYIPDRFTEGYGLTGESVRALAAKGFELVITVDCGTTSVKELDLANELGIDFIITDHHEPPPNGLPAACAVINPKIEGKTKYPFDGLAGVGVAFKLAHALFGGKEINQFLASQLDLVTLATVADMAPLIGENRTLTRLGLPFLNERKRPGINALCQVARHTAEKTIDGYAIGFVLGPRINAAGRIAHAQKSVELLMAKSHKVAHPLAVELDALNAERKELQNEILRVAVDQAKELSVKYSLIVSGENWSPGVVGLVASKLKDRFYLPACVISISGDVGTASARGINGNANLADALNACDELLVKHGGHKLAAGFTIKVENIPEFTKRFDRYMKDHLSEKDLEPKVKADFELELHSLTEKSVVELSLLEPTGEKNRGANLVIRNLKRGSKSAKVIGQDKRHLKFSVSDGSRKVDTICFGMADRAIHLENPNVNIDLICTPQINRWNGRKSLQLKVEDLRLRNQERNKSKKMFPPPDADSPVKLIDGREVSEKIDYIRQMLEEMQHTVIYVRGERESQQLVAMLKSSSDRLIALCDQKTKNYQKQLFAEMLADNRLTAIISSVTLKHLPACMHMFFCHPLSHATEFFDRISAGFRTPHTTYVHLLYNKTDFVSQRKILDRKYPDRNKLGFLYKKLSALAGTSSNEITVDRLISQTVGKGISNDTISQALLIFEELGLISIDEKSGEIGVLQNRKVDLSDSKIYQQGELIKETSDNFSFVLRQELPQLWGNVLLRNR